jgi:assimilatory nitrate reductase catalytic subunit
MSVLGVNPEDVENENSDAQSVTVNNHRKKGGIDHESCHQDHHENRVIITRTEKTNVKTTCPYCGVGCGVKASSSAPISGDTQHPANRGRLCVKGSSLHETLGNRDRLLAPRVEGQDTSWSEALTTVADRFNKIIAEHGPDSVAFYVSGQLLTEDYYVANKLMKGFIGSGNIDTNSRLCMSSAVAAHKRAFGEDVVPGCYEDLELADLVVLTGSNTAWAHPIVYQRIAAAKERRPEMRVVVIDPRKTATCDIADLHLAIAPGADAFLFAGLLVWLADEEYLDSDYIDQHTNGFDQALKHARAACGDVSQVALRCGLNETDVKMFYRWFARTAKTVTLFSQGINQSETGTDKGNSIINAHLATGRVGLPGSGPFSITGQPNAMGGREVGGLSNQLAAHLDIENPLHRGLVQDFWQSPDICREPGLKAVDMFDAVAKGKIKAIWIMATNPVVSLPNSEKVRKALMDCEFVVVSDCIASTDTSLCADVLLPAAGWGEKDGTVTNSERCISRQRAFLPLLGESKPDWWIVSQVAAYMGHGQAFDYDSAAAIFREHAALSKSATQHNRVFDLSALATISDQRYARLEPLQWPVNDVAPGGQKRLYAEGNFSTVDGRAVFVAVKPSVPEFIGKVANVLCLNSGRVRDQWHTMTRTGRTAKLFRHIAEPFVEVHPLDVKGFLAPPCDDVADDVADGVTDGVANDVAGIEYVEVNSAHGSALVKLVVTDAQQRGSVFMPIHWNDQFASRARVDALVAPITDPHSGQPAFKQTAVTVEAWQPKWQGWLLSSPLSNAVRQDIQLPCEYWARMPLTERADGWALAGKSPISVEVVKQWVTDPLVEWIELCDEEQGHYRVVALDRQRQPILWMAWSEQTNPKPDLEWLAEQFDQTITGADRIGLLSGASAQRGPDLGAVVCSCFQVRERTILAAVEAGADTVEKVGRACRAGTNCGSCIPELRAIIA